MTQPLPQGLYDIVSPPTPNFWPLAPGWYALMIIAFIGGIFLAMAAKRWSQRFFMKREALAECTRLETLHQQNQPIAPSLSVLMRRVAIGFHSQQAAAQQGDAWLVFLNATGKTDAFTTDTGRLLLTAPYQAQPHQQQLALLKLCRQWIRRQG